MMEKTGTKGLKRKVEQNSALDISISAKKKKVKQFRHKPDKKPITEDSKSLPVNANTTPSGNEIPKAESKKRRKHKKNKIHVAALPEKPEDISSNWKNLLKTLDADKQGKKKNPIVFFHPYRRKKFLEAKAYSGKKQLAVKMEEEPKKKPEIWFDDVDETLLDPEDRPNFPTSSYNATDDLGMNAADSALVKEKAFKG